MKYLKHGMIIMACILLFFMTGCGKTDSPTDARQETIENKSSDQSVISWQADYFRLGNQYAQALAAEDIYGCYLEDDRILLDVVDRQDFAVKETLALSGATEVAGMTAGQEGVIYLLGSKGESTGLWRIDPEGNLSDYVEMELEDTEEVVDLSLKGIYADQDEILFVWCEMMVPETEMIEGMEREELVLATVDVESDLAAMAVKFNRGNSRYRLTVKSYESLTDLYNAILIKEPMDLIDLSGINVQRLVDRGLLENLTSYVNQSEVFDRSDFVDGILDVYTCDNVLVGIPAEFMIRTVVGNSAQLDNKAGLALEELYSFADRYPGVKAFDGVTREEMMQYLMMFNEDTFIDWDTGVCHFDSEEFKAVLEYVGQFPDDLTGGKDEESLSVKMERGEVLFAIKETYLYTWWDCVKMFGEDAACVGFPTVDGRGGHLLISSNAYAIAAVSEHKESAWVFIEDSLTQEKSELYAELWRTYPTLKKTLEERMEIAMDRDDRLTWDDFNVALTLVPDATPFFAVNDDEIIQIINEEAGAYYSGQKSVDDVINVIQNRVQIYVDENK